MTHHFVMTSSLRIKNFKIDKFGDFSSEIDYHSRIDVFRDAISLIINKCSPRRPKGASGGHKVSASRAAQASEARLFKFIHKHWGEIFSDTLKFVANLQYDPWFLDSWNQFHNRQSISGERNCPRGMFHQSRLQIHQPLVDFY